MTDCTAEIPQDPVGLSLGFITQAITANFVPLLFLNFKDGLCGIGG